MDPKHGLMMLLFPLKFGFLQVHFLCFLCELLFFRANIQAGRAGLRAGATSSNPARSSSCSSSCTGSSSSPESSTGSDQSGSTSGGIMVTTSSEKRTCRFASTRLWASRIKRMNSLLIWLIMHTIIHLYTILHTTRRQRNTSCFFILTLLLRISTEDSESWDTECLRTPFGGLAKDGKTDGERGGHEYKGRSPSRWDASVAPISQLLQADMDTSVRWERAQWNCMMRPQARWTSYVYWGDPDLCLGVVHLSEGPCPSSQLSGDVFFCSFVLCSSSMSCFEHLQAAYEIRLTVFHKWK